MNAIVKNMDNIYCLNYKQIKLQLLNLQQIDLLQQQKLGMILGKQLGRNLIISFEKIFLHQ